MSRLAKIGDWFEQRLKIWPTIVETSEHRVPTKSASWFYVFGSAAFTVFLVQIFTGIMLALIYVPSAGQAWDSLQYLNHGVPLGWFLRAVHGWGSNFMVAIVLIHMVQVALFGAYKFPRELTWIVGVFLLLMTLGMAFTGQVMRFDLRPRTVHWKMGGTPVARGANHRGRYAVEVLRVPRFRDSGTADRVCLGAFADGAEAGHQ